MEKRFSSSRFSAIFGAIVAVFALSAIIVSSGPNAAYAAGRDVSGQFNATAEIKAINNIKINATGSLAGIKAGDYIDFHVNDIFAQAFDLQQVTYQGVHIGDARFVGEFFIDKTRLGVVDESIEPSVSKGYIRITFNEAATRYADNILNLEAVSSTFYMAVNKDWVARSSISFNGNIIAEKDTPVSKRNPYGTGTTKANPNGPLYFNYNTGESLFNLNLDNDNWNPYVVGDKIKVLLGDSAEIRFKESADPIEIDAKITPYYVYQSTPINNHGVYFPNETNTLKVRLNSISDKEIDIEILGDAPKTDYLYVVELRNILKAASEDIPLNTTIRIQDITYETHRKGNVTRREKGANLNVSGSKIETKVELKEEFKAKTINTEPKVSLKAPNTGFAINNKSSLYPLTFISAVLTIISFVVIKK